jgi:hypothetical protein
MVKKRHLPIVLIGIFIFLTFISITTAQTEIQYHLEQEWVDIWINQDGTIYLLYNVSVTCDFGTIHYVRVGQPNENFTIESAQDEANRTLNAIDTGEKRVQVYLYTPISSGQTARFSLMTKVAHMIWEDTPDNVGMQFTPSWYGASILDLRVLIVLPPNVNVSEVHTTKILWNNTQYEGDRLAIYWEKHNLSPNEQFPVGVSFPKQYVEHYDTQPTGLVAFFQRYGTVLFAFVFVTFMIGGVIIFVRKKSYLLPKISMETLGIRRGLTAVEASYLLEMQPPKIVTEILYSLLQKRAIWVESTNPSLKLKVMQPFQDKTGTPETPLRYYEMDFLKALKEDGPLEEEKLAHTIMFLRDAVEQKMRGYCRRDTIDYYRKIVAKAWGQVQQAGTSELASKAYDEQLLWLLLDPDVQSRTETVFHDRAFEPSPFWLWYWYGYQHYHPSPTYKPNVEIPVQSAKPPTIPGADFANNIATAVEKTSNNIVVNLERFANAILPMPEAKGSSEPARHGASCVCACASCACVCACVSCACACASGGVG